MSLILMDVISFKLMIKALPKLINQYYFQLYSEVKKKGLRALRYIRSNRNYKICKALNELLTKILKIKMMKIYNSFIRCIF